jgi:hypothetical protein
LGLGLIPDEAYYWVWSRELHFSYYDQGPGVAIYIRFFTYLFGDTQFAIKLAAIMASFLTSFNLLNTGRLLNLSERQQNWVLILTQFIPGFFVGSLLVMHDSPLFLFWSTAIYFVIHYISKRDTLSIYCLFIALGFGGLSKHSMVFFVFSLILWLILSKKEWNLLSNVHLYLGIILTALIILPMVYWNYNNDWDNIDAIVNLRSSGGVNSKGASTIKMIAGQVVSLSPLWFITFISICYAGIRFLLKGKENILLILNDSPKLFLIINALVLPIFFFIMSFKKDVQANWIFPAYLSGILLFAKNLTFEPERTIDKIILFTTKYGFYFALLFNLYSILSVPINTLTGSKLEPYYVIGYRYEGFKEAATKVMEFKNRIDSSADIIANRYQDAAILSWFLPNKPNIQSLNILQKNEYNYSLNLVKGKNYILVHIEEKTCEKSFLFFQPYLKMMFEEVIEYPEENIVLYGDTIKRLQIWHLKNYQKSWATSANFYMQNTLIQTLLPSLQRTDTRKIKENGNQEMAIELLQNYMGRQGEVECSILKK